MRSGVLVPLGTILLVLAACRDEPVPDPLRVAGGDPEAGRRLLETAGFGCGTCHTIPGVGGARGTVGPPLTAFGRRGYIAGRQPNRPDALVLWLLDPPGVEPGTAMPAVGLDPAQARHIAAYLYTLR